MKILSCIVSLTLFFFIMSGGLHNNSLRAKEVHLQKDELYLQHLTQAYQKEKVGALVYVKEYNILKQRIKQEKEILANGYISEY